MDPAGIKREPGEIEMALEGKLPKLIDYKDIKGDLHCHSKWDGGANTIAEIAEAAEKMGYQYIGIADHTKFLRIEHGLDEAKLELQRREIDKLNQKLKIENCKLKILQGLRRIF
jgi:DNA polymerase (family 10)